MTRVAWIVAALLPLAGFGAAAAPPERVIEVASRPGQGIRALQIAPEKPVGSVILLAGGHGNLSLGKDGKLGWGAGNQLVRTRAAYAAAGFLTIVPDIAGDHKRGAETVDGYRWSPEHASDLGALVGHARAIAAPVYLVGTSRAALSVTNAATRLTGAARPDAIVVTSGMLVRIDAKHPSAETNVGRLERITQPTLIVYHEKDGCPYTPASSASRAKALLKGAARVDIKLMNGGSPGSGDPCKAQSHHGFLGQDTEVVGLVTEWLNGLQSR